MADDAALRQEIQTGKRFAFGKNWQAFLVRVSEQHVRNAEMSLIRMLGFSNMDGKRFLDAGSGSGLFSLAARNLGATVYSFDYDPSSVRCAEALRQKFRPDDQSWTIEQGSVLDEGYLGRLGQFDVVYSWGVLHHTGDMWRALGRLSPLVSRDGLLYIALYNDQGIVSEIWKRIKQLYLKTPGPLKPFIHFPLGLGMWLPIVLKDLLVFKPFQTLKNYSAIRGMSPYNDLIDWVGGYPFEVAKPVEVTSFLEIRGFRIKKISIIGRGAGNNEYVFVREQQDVKGLAGGA